MIRSRLKANPFETLLRACGWDGQRRKYSEIIQEYEAIGLLYHDKSLAFQSIFGGLLIDKRLFSFLNIIRPSNFPTDTRLSQAHAGWPSLDDFQDEIGGFIDELEEEAQIALSLIGITRPADDLEIELFVTKIGNFVAREDGHELVLYGEAAAGFRTFLLGQGRPESAIKRVCLGYGPLSKEQISVLSKW